MSSIERIGLGNQFTELSNQRSNESTNSELASENTIQNNLQDNIQTTEIAEDAVTNEINSEIRSTESFLNNDDGDTAQLSENGAQLAENVGVNEPLALE